MKKKMKILYFNYLYDLYGVSIGSTIKAEKLMDFLSNHGYDIKIYWQNKQPDTNKNAHINWMGKIRKYFSKYVHIKILLTNIIYIIKEFKIVNKQKPNLIISRLDLLMFSSLVVSKIKKIPLIIEADAPCAYEAQEFHKQFWKMPRIPELIEKLNLYNADLSICVSNQAKSYFLDYNIPYKKLKVITNGADIKKFNNVINNEEIVNKFNLDNKIVIGFIGSFHIWHGIDNLINIIKQALLKNSKIAFLLVGQGGYMRSVLERFLETERIFDNVQLTGFVSHDEIPQYISAMDIVVAPYPNLKFFYYSPVKLFEYMACQKPVLTTDIGQLAEIITDGENGILCKPSDQDDLLKKLFLLIEDEALRRKIGLNARRTIVDKYTWSQKARNWSDYCASVVRQFEEGKKR